MCPAKHQGKLNQCHCPSLPACPGTGTRLRSLCQLPGPDPLCHPSALAALYTDKDAFWESCSPCCPTAIPWHQAGTHIGAVCGHLGMWTPAPAVVMWALVSALGWQQRLGPPLFPPIGAWWDWEAGIHFRSTTASRLPRPPGNQAGWAQGVPHRGRALLALQLVLGWRALGKGQVRCWQQAVVLHPLHCPCSCAWGLGWVFRTQLSAREREEGRQPCQEWDRRLQSDRRETFPSEPQLWACGGQEQPPLLLTPCLQLCLPSPRAWPRPPGCSCSPSPKSLDTGSDVGALAGRGRSFPSCSRGHRIASPSPYPPGVADASGSEPQEAKDTSDPAAGQSSLQHG